MSFPLLNPLHNFRVSLNINSKHRPIAYVGAIWGAEGLRLDVHQSHDSIIDRWIRFSFLRNSLIRQSRFSRTALNYRFHLLHKLTFKKIYLIGREGSRNLVDQFSYLLYINLLPLDKIWFEKSLILFNLNLYSFSKHLYKKFKKLFN